MLANKYLVLELTKFWKFFPCFGFFNCGLINKSHFLMIIKIVNWIIDIIKYKIQYIANSFKNYFNQR